jgi:hypothetical protein
MGDDLPLIEVCIVQKINNLKAIQIIQIEYKLVVLNYPKVQVCQSLNENILQCQDLLTW